MTRDEAGEGSKAPIMESLVYPSEDCRIVALTVDALVG